MNGLLCLVLADWLCDPALYIMRKSIHRTWYTHSRTGFNVLIDLEIILTTTVLLFISSPSSSSFTAHCSRAVLTRSSMQLVKESYRAVHVLV